MNTSTDKTAASKTPGLGAKLFRFMKYWYLRLVRIQATPHNIAIGLAAGVFVGLLPVLPFQTILAVGLAFLVRGSKIAAALGTWVSNPLNWVPVYMAFYYVGRAVVPFDVPPFNPAQLEMQEMLHVGWKFFAVMMVGGLVIAIPSALVSYCVAFKAVQTYRERRKARLARTHADEAAQSALRADERHDPHRAQETRSGSSSSLASADTPHASPEGCAEDASASRSQPRPRSQEMP